MRALRRCLTCSDDELLTAYWSFHPRFRFLKTVPANAAMLDVGAGTGGLAHWKSWGEPKRVDINLHGVDLRPGPEAHLYRAWESVNLDETLPSFADTVFDAFLLSHVIEHLRDPATLLRWIASRIQPGGRAYIEWPGANAARQPGREAFLRHGIDIVITNFFDDSTHLRMLPREEVIAHLTAAGFTIVESGTIDHGLVGEELLACGLAGGDSFARLAGYWSLSLWADWIVAAWPGPRRGAGPPVRHVDSA